MNIRGIKFPDFYKWIKHCIEIVTYNLGIANFVKYVP